MRKRLLLASAAAGSPAQIDWNVAGGVPHPVLQGQLVMNNVPGVQARVRVRYFDNVPNHALLNTQASPVFNGMMGVAVFATNVGPEPGSAHAHVELVVNGAVVNTATTCTMGVAAC